MCERRLDVYHLNAQSLEELKDRPLADRTSLLGDESDPLLAVNVARVVCVDLVEEHLGQRI